MDKNKKPANISYSYVGKEIEDFALQVALSISEIMEEHQREYDVLLKEKMELERRCKEYEQVIIENRKTKSFVVHIKVLCANKKEQCKQKIKYLSIRVSKQVFAFGRKFTGSIGIKETLKSTKVFKRLFAKGTIDKLRE